MLNYIKAEFYRIISKRSLYIYFGSFTLAYILMTLLQYSSMGDLNQASLISKGSFVLEMVGLFGSVFLFASIYNDDLTAKSLPALIGFGARRTMIIISKIIITILLMVTMYFVALGAFWAIFSCLGFVLDAGVMNVLLNSLLLNVLRTIAFAIITSVIVYGFQKPVLSLVMFILFSTSIISSLLLTLLRARFVQNAVGDLSGLTIFQITTKLSQTASLATIIPYAIYLGIFISMSILAFHKKDLEF